jgi:4'-phosphopantetheinyl transferase
VIEVYALSLREDVSEDTVAKWLSYVTPEQRERLSRYRRRADFLRSLAGEAMVREIVGAEVGVQPAALAIARSEQGKPYLADYPHIHFNISHAGEWVVCAVSEHEVGVDIEKVREKGLSPALIKRVLSEREREQLAALTGEVKKVAFYCFWTMKEAYAKRAGRGLGMELREIMLENDDKVRVLDFCAGYVLAVCGEEAEVAAPFHCNSFML